MPVKEFALDASKFALDASSRSISISWNGDHWNDLIVVVDGSIVARVPDLEELKSGKEISLEYGTVLKVQVVDTTLQVTSNGRRLLGGYFMSPAQQRKTRSGSDHPQGNWLTSPITNSKVAAIFSETILCRIGIHQGTWTTEGCSGCWQRRFCMYCGRTQQGEVHNWPWGVYEYFMDGSCETRMTCLDCGKTKFTGKKHVGRTSYWNALCKRCGEYLDGNVE